MNIFVGFLIWISFGVLAGVLVHKRYPAAGTTATMTLVFAFFGAMIGGMIGIFPYIFHDPVPLRAGGLIGASLGALFFPGLYHFIARKVV